ncbi:MAG TPA: hypothetical protein VNT99_14270 [Methylomirabilota bacterium]|nr:hypothetical protein [Methylomirabilota bacterium]
MLVEPSEKLLDFFRSELLAEDCSGFARLSCVPDSCVAAHLDYYKTLGTADRTAYIDCCAHWARAHYGFVIGAPRIDHTRHPFFGRWNSVLINDEQHWNRSVPALRTAVAQYKIDKHRGIRSSISEEYFALASSIQSIKAPELRKRVRAALQPLGYIRIDRLGGGDLVYCCRLGGREFHVHVDYRGRDAQLRYRVAFPEFRDTHPVLQFCFEDALGFGHGHWDFIVEPNVDDSFALFTEVVLYCVGCQTEFGRRLGNFARIDNACWDIPPLWG